MIQATGLFVDCNVSGQLVYRQRQQQPDNGADDTVRPIVGPQWGLTAGFLSNSFSRPLILLRGNRLDRMLMFSANMSAAA